MTYFVYQLGEVSSALFVPFIVHYFNSKCHLNYTVTRGQNVNPYAFLFLTYKPGMDGQMDYRSMHSAQIA